MKGSKFNVQIMYDLPSSFTNASLLNLYHIIIAHL